MDYFKSNQRHLSVREGDVPNSGMRRGQAGALHALSGHFIERNDPAIISLPTGYGKTALLTASGYLLKATRLLVITPTTVLRAQCAKAFRTLDTLKRLQSIPFNIDLPSVAVVDERMSSEAHWQAFMDADVVVCTPHSASPEIEGVVAAPDGMFDLVLMDEGHHSAAKTWSAFIRSMPQARHVLFTATPFRHDRRQLPGKLAFYYPMKKAVEESAFGRVKFCPVHVDQDSLPGTKDAALIAKAVEIHARDQALGLEHRILARADRIQDAERLAQQYVAEGLRVDAISSRNSRAQIEDCERRLVEGSLDGVVCVDMFGEGYDFPKFKIAVLHSAHKSLVPTLQFIGRFARTNDESTGEATFIAVPQDVESESSELYKEGVDWDVLLADVAEARQQLSLRERETLQSFSETARPSADYEAVNPGAFRLGQHIAAYRTTQAPDFNAPPDSLISLRITNAWISEDETTLLLLAKSTRPPYWYRDDHLVDAVHECFLVRYFPDSELMFITATERSKRYYGEIVSKFVDGNASPLPYDQIRRVLNGMSDQEFFSIGIRSTSLTASSESYRILAGSNADRGVRDSDATNFAQGHFMGRGEVDGTSEIIGASAGGRVWSNGKLSVAQILDWMTALHGRITSAHVNIGQSGLDRLSYGESFRDIPGTTCSIDWPKAAYRDNPRVIMGDGGVAFVTTILDLQVTSIDVAADGASLTFLIGDDAVQRRLRYRLRQTPQFEFVGDGVSMEVEMRNEQRISIAEWLEENDLVFYTKELDSFFGATLQRRHSKPSVSPECLVRKDWTGCETTVEFDVADRERRTVQRVLQDELVALPDLRFVIYDHRSGEAADFIVAQEGMDGRLLISLYHCKGAGGQPSGERVDDVYELAGQSAKSGRFQNKHALISHVDRRTQPRPARGHSPFLVGSRDVALELLRDRDPIAINLVVYAVQPGLAPDRLSDNVKTIMASANDSLAAQGVDLKWLVHAPAIAA
jgi:superfamily II DNA or RNA helicase